MRVIVIGSGIAGLTAAIALRKVGIEVSVYERAGELREIGAGISLWANALRALDYLGVGQAVRGAALGLARSEMRTHQGHTILGEFSGDALEQKLGIRPVVAMIHRADLVGTLASFLPDGVAQYGFDCVGVEHHGERVGVRFANGHSDEADVVIGADGIKSVVRTILFGAQEPRYSGYTCWRGISPRPNPIAPGYVGEWWGRGKRFGITTLPNNRIYWFAVCNAVANQHSAQEKEVVAHLFQDWANPVPEIIATTPPDRLIHNDIIDRPPTRLWAMGRIGLIGDAAHPTTPNLGQGGCMAIEDGVALARALITHSDSVEALDAFTAERYKRTTQITNESWRIGKIAQLEGSTACWIRDHLFGILMPLFGAKAFAKYAAFDIGPLPNPNQFNTPSEETKESL